MRAALRPDPQPATADERDLYARWSGWGATPALFDERARFAARFAGERAELQQLLGEDGYRAARATTLNAHYTDPQFVTAIWAAVTQLGFAGGTVLEPGCGSGNLFVGAPVGSTLVGVEIDPTTARIAQARFPHAEIRAESFADTSLPDTGFDLVIGNVPFGSHKLHDPRHNPGRQHSIHNHFILKALHATRPDGLVAVITSRYTMDGRDDAHHAARTQMAALADLVGAVRLPSEAHAAAAGTDVVTDLLILRRRADGQPPADTAWMQTQAVQLPAAEATGPTDTFDVNEYFLDRPAMVLGQQLTHSGRHRPVLVVQADTDTVGAALTAALDRIVAAATEPPEPPAPPRAPTPDQEGLFIDAGDGRFFQVRDGRRARHEPASTQVAELRALIGLRETILALLDEEATHRTDTPQTRQLRADLNRRYDAYVAAHGAINRFQRATGTRVDKKTGDVVESERRTYPRMGGFRDDPFFPYVSALERFDDDSGTADRAEVFTQRVITVPSPVDHVDTADDALVVCWDRHNEVRLDVIAALLGLDTEAQARDALAGLVFEEPGTGRLIRKAEYLSGNVRRKLDAAQHAAATDAQFQANVTALQEVIPRDLTAGEISARLGAPWISAGYVQQFLQEILEDPGVRVANIGASWSVTGGAKSGVLATTVWGTRNRPATDLAASLLNSQTIEITKTVGTGKEARTVRDSEATAFAQAKSQQLDDRFRAWLWEDPERAAALGRTYNDRFNARVVRSYDGEHITAPGMSAAFTLRPHQMAAVARIRNTRGTGLFHGTGAGKTLEMIVGGMELVRLGLVSKPAYVVPKGVLGQFRREFLQAYPRAKVLAADSEDLEGDKRRQFVARCSTGTWDAIIISHNAFKKIPVSREVKVAYLNKQLDRLKKHLENTEGADRYTVKDVEKQVATLQEQIKEQLATPSDPGVEFERTGIGYLFIDEAHVYKNLRVISAIPELAHPGNQITADLEMKLEYLRRTSARVVTLATATPIDNSPSEILTMTKYAAPELLAEMGIEEDDQYHAAFIQPRRRIEMRADGSGFVSKTRHSRFVNLPEQKQLMYSWADVKLKEHLDLGEPAIIGGQPEILSVPASSELRQHLVSLAARARAVTSGSPEPRLTTKGVLRDDNILWISTDGRTASLDLRLMGAATTEPQKLDVAADWLAASWNEHKDDLYYRPDGTPDPERGSLHLVFCDLGVPRDDRWNIYDGLRDALVARGMPAEKIRFAQDATNRRQKDQLDQDARDGKIAVLIGSRAGLGTGRNIQRRVISIMQLDPTWKLSPVVQSLGRGQRQGNANPAIHHVFVVTENSYDPFLWQKVDDKARFTKQMLDPNDTTRIIDAQEDDTDGQIDPAVMFAVAAGRPELLELHRIEETVGALRLEQRIWGDEQVTLKATVEQNRRTTASLHRTIGELDEVLARRVDTRGDAFRMTLDGATFDTRAAAGAALISRLHPAVHTAYGRTQLHLGQLGGIALHATIEPDLLGHRALLDLDGISDSTIALTQRELDTLAADDGQERVGLIRKLENRLTGADDLRTRQLEAIDRLQANIDRATDRIGLPFPRRAELDEHTAKLATLHKQLRIIDVAVSDATATPDTVTPDPAGPDGAPTPYAAEDQLPPRRTDANDVAAVDEPARAVAATTTRPNDSDAASAGSRGPVAVASDTRNGGAETQSRHDTPPSQQLPAAAGLPELHRRRRGHPFYPPADITATVPELYATDAQPAEDKLLHLHYFGGSFDAWLAEYDPATGTGYGFVNHGDPSDAEWGYVDLPEVEAINRGLLIIERDLYWTPVRAGDANLPGPRAPRPTASPTAEPAPATTPADSTATDPDQRSTAVAGPDIAQATTTPSRPVTAPSALPPAMTPSQRAAIDELGNDRGEPWTIRREWRMRTFAEVSADDLAGLTADDRRALTADVQESLTSPAWRERATARRLLDRWSGHPTTHTEAQAAAIDVLCLPASSYDIPDAGRLSHYGRLTVEEYLTLDPAYQDDIKADLKAIAASGATKTIPRNRTSTGTTIRGVPADHVVAADNLLRRMASGLEIAPYHSNDGNVGRTVVGLRLNPGDQVQLRSGTVTVDRVGINLTVYLVGGSTLPDSTRRYRLVAVGPAPVIGDAVADRGAPPTVTQDPSPVAAPPAPESSRPAAPSDPTTTTAPALHDGQRSGGRTAAAADTDQPTPATVQPVQTSPAPRPAWLNGVAISEETPTADGQHHVWRRTNRHGTAVYVDARHPQVGMLPRGRITVAPDHVHDDGPVTTWQLVDHDGTEIGEHTGPYSEAEARLLAATAELDEPLGDQDLAELAEEADAQQPEQDSEPGEAHHADSTAAAAPAATVEAAADPPTEPPALTGVASAPPLPAPNIGTTAAGNDSLPETPTSWSSRIQVIDGTALIVRGTDGSRREDGLRGLLKQHRFRWQGSNREWRYTGRPTDRPAALGDIQRWLAAQDRADANRAHQPAPAMAPTGQQQHIIDAYQAGRTIAVQALAGTGKTSTLLMLANARPQARIAYIAFNAAIAAEAARKFPRHVRAGTAHSFAREALGNSPLRDKVGRVRTGARWPDEWAAHLNIEGHVGPDVVEPERVARMVMATIRVFRESAADTIGPRHLPTGMAEETPELARVVLDHARTAWADIIHPDGKLFFDHDDYLKAWALTHPAMPYDTIFFDEAQDINDVLRQVIQEQPAQTIVVGDSNQSIYGFRGAIDALKRWPADTTLPLTQSWRFGPAVADVGNQFLSLLDSRWRLTGNPSLDSSIGVVEEPDAVLARTNAGAVAAVVDAVDAGRRVALLGGGKMIEDIAKAAQDLQAGRATKHPDLNRFATWDEVRTYVEDGEADAQSLRAFVNLVDRRGADALLQMVRELVNDSETTPDGEPAYDVIVSTVHKSKGREWDRVRIASDFPQPQTNQQTGQTLLPNDEQLRLAYVAVTRAKQRLELGSLAWIDDVAGQQPTAAATALAATRVTQPQSATVATAPDPADAAQTGEPLADPPATLTSAAQRPAPSRDATMTPDTAGAEPDRSDPPVASHRTAPSEGRDDTELDDPMRRFTSLEQADIRTAVADHAGFYFLGPLNPGRESAARYVSEGHLRDLADRYGLAAVWDAVTAVIDADPSVLELTETQRADLRAHRQDRAEQIAAAALAAFKAGDYHLAQELVTRGELLDPQYRPGRTEHRPYGIGWHQMTEAITHRRNDAAPAEPSQQGDHDGLDQPRHRTAAQLARLDTAVALGTAASRHSDPRAAHARTETANGNRAAAGL
ncbi:AAA family ATPase [Dactylosporangium sp. NBC_01737]|uniref:UvrD-helicase domain-containing protein n=1 Tax=Dactylosporangium sp. NBC_01737 TaxID=2975959 RepID=UPI002E10A34C|nr:AAA family ATPase [Dactylosporangium sp. NBC_01737]